jgi:hypothetical protein
VARRSTSPPESLQLVDGAKAEEGISLLVAIDSVCVGPRFTATKTTPSPLVAQAAGPRGTSCSLRGPARHQLTNCHAGDAFAAVMGDALKPLKMG